MTGFLLTHDFSYYPSEEDEAARWAYGHERALRELRYRVTFPENVPTQVLIAEMVPARDAGDVCAICHRPVTWVDHLPPEHAGGPVRCRTNVHELRRDIVVDDIFPRV